MFKAVRDRYARLESVIALARRKQRKDFVALAGLFVVSVFVVLFVLNVYGHVSLRDALTYGGGYILMFSSVAFPSFMGAVPGSQLRKEPNRSVEEVLPVSPIDRVFGTYLASLVQMLILVSLQVALQCIVFYAGNISNWSLVLAGGGLLLLVFHLFCFYFGYWLRSPLIAVCLAALLLLIYELGMGWIWVKMAFGLSFAGPVPMALMALSVAACPATVLFLLDGLARKVEREVRGLRFYTLHFVMLLGIPPTVALLMATITRVYLQYFSAASSLGIK